MTRNSENLDLIDNDHLYHAEIYSTGKGLFEQLDEIDAADSNQVDSFINRLNPVQISAINSYQTAKFREVDPPVKQAIDAEINSCSKLRLDDLITLYIDFHTKTHNAWTLKSTEKYRYHLTMLKDMIGNQPTDAVTKELLRDKFSNRIHKIPKHINEKKHLYWDGAIKKRYDEIIRIAEVSNAERISNRTACDVIGNIKTFLRWAEDEQYIQRGTGDFLRKFAKLSKKTKPKSRKFTDTELKNLFESTEYKTGVIQKKPFRYWVPLIALFTGARESEICQLHISDIYYADKEKTYVFSFNDDENKRLKNEHSRRLTPVHSKLIDIGLLRFIEQQKQKKHIQLFPELKQDKYGHSGRKVSRWFNGYESNGKRVKGYKEKCGILAKEGEDKNFHSFRHTFMNYGKQHRLDGEVMREMCGHASSKNDVHSIVYEDDYSLEERKKVMAKVKFNIDFDVIKRWP